MKPPQPRAVLSLSENGCLVRSSEPLVLGSRFDLQFDLPGRGTVALTGEVAYQLVPDVGVIFQCTAPLDRQAIARFVDDLLLA